MLSKFCSRALLRTPIATTQRRFTSTSWRYDPSPQPCDLSSLGHKKRDVIIIGGGHNGLTAAAYLSKAGLDVLVLERRHIVGGAAVTEEVFEGFKFSRAAYLAGLLRPKVLEELQLKERYGLQFIVRNPSSFTPTKLDDPLYGGKSLMFWNGEHSARTNESIAQFSAADALAMDEFEAFLGEIRNLLQPFLDHRVPDFSDLDASSLLSMLTAFGKKRKARAQSISPLMDIFSTLKNNGNAAQTALNLAELLTSPASKILNIFFESEIVKTTLATDAVIGSTLSPSDCGSAYVLLHHVMGESEGLRGVWSYCVGGMGAISDALAQCATDSGTQIVCNAQVAEIIVEKNAKRVSGVRMADDTVIRADYVLSNATPQHTFAELIANKNSDELESLDKSFATRVSLIDYQCGAFKINLVVDKLPNFECAPNEFDADGVALVGPQHKGTVHFESRMSELESASLQSKRGVPADRPIVEMTIPSSLDASLVTNEELRRRGYHVVQLFVQHAPYDLNAELCGVSDWNANGGAFKKEFVRRVLDIIDEFAPTFSASVVHCDALSPRDLEQIFGLYKGNIFHGAISLDQIGWNRPVKDIMGGYTTPLEGLFLCGAGAHPGGGVMGAPGRNCANHIKSLLKLK